MIMTVFVQWETSGQCGVFSVPSALMLALLPQEHVVPCMFRGNSESYKMVLCASTTDVN